MVLAPKPTIPFLTTIFEGPFWSVFGGGGAVKINKNHENEAFLKGGGFRNREKSLKWCIGAPKMSRGSLN